MTFKPTENSVKGYQEFLNELTRDQLYSHKSHVEGIIDLYLNKRRLIDKEIELSLIRAKK